MSVCSTCKSEGTRIRTIFSEDGQRDACPHCSPESFEKFTAPSDKKIWMGYEAHPNEYEKRYDKDGVYYVHKPEYRAEQEQRLRQETDDERDARVRAEANKRANRRTNALDAIELAAALGRAEEIAAWLVQPGETN